MEPCRGRFCLEEYVVIGPSLKNQRIARPILGASRRALLPLPWPLVGLLTISRVLIRAIRLPAIVLVAESRAGGGLAEQEDAFRLYGRLQPPHTGSSQNRVG